MRPRPGRAAWCRFTPAAAADHILFGSDSPFDPERGPGYIRATIANLEEIGLSEAEKEAIFRGNVTRLTGLTVKG